MEKSEWNQNGATRKSEGNQNGATQTHFSIRRLLSGCYRSPCFHFAASMKRSLILPLSGPRFCLWPPFLPFMLQLGDAIEDSPLEDDDE